MLVIGSIFLNLAFGAVLMFLPDVNARMEETHTIIYDNNDANDFRSSMNGSVAPMGLLQPKEGLFIRLLDLISLGLYNKMISTINLYIHGFWIFLNNAVGRYLEINVKNFLFGSSGNYGLFSIVTDVGYALFAFKLWTGRELRD